MSSGRTRRRGTSSRVRFAVITLPSVFSNRQIVRAAEKTFWVTVWSRLRVSLCFGYPQPSGSVGFAQSEITVLSASKRLPTMRLS